VWKILEINYEKNILNSINRCELYIKKKGTESISYKKKAPYQKHFSSSFIIHANTRYTYQNTLSPINHQKQTKKSQNMWPPQPLSPSTTLFSLKKPNKKKYLPCFSHSPAHTHTFSFFWKHVKKAPLSSLFPRTFHLYLQPLGKQEANLLISLFKQNKIVNPLSLSRINIKTKKEKTKFFKRKRVSPSIFF